MLKRFGLTLVAGGLLLATAMPAQAQQAATCQFVLGFKTLHDMDAADVGGCIDDQASADNGDAQQHTANGLMAWRKTDNWTAFTNGYRTWLNGPLGLAARLNTERYPWEADYNAPGVTKLVPPAPPAPALTANGKNWTVAFDHNLVLPGISVQDSQGHLTPLPPSGHWINIYFRVRNNQAKPASLTSDNVSLGDKQGRTFVSKFDLRQVNPTEEITLVNPIAPGATPLVRITLDVPLDATGGVLHLSGGNDVAAL